MTYSKINLTKVCGLLLLTTFVLLVGCNSGMKEFMDEDREATIRWLDREQKEDDLRDKTDLSCVSNKCMVRCSTPCLVNLTYNPFCFDHDNNSEIDGFEHEIMQSALERSRDCNYNCFQDSWKYMDECRNDTQALNDFLNDIPQKEST